VLNEEGALKEVVSYWTEKANDSLSAARDDLRAGRLSFASQNDNHEAT
jgi:hypothetical protein